MDWTPFLRQLYLCTGPWTLIFMQGLYLGFLTVLVPQLKKDNQTISAEQHSWLPTMFTYGGIPWVILLSAAIVSIGQKKSHIIVCVTTLIGFIIFYFSTNINHFFIGTVVLGPLSCCHTTTNIGIFTECVSSKYRGIFLTLESATLFWGILVANAIGTFFHWHIIVILGAVCALYTLLNVIIWPESPLWLATKGRFEDCSKVHRWLKGDKEESEQELKQLLKLYEDTFVKPKFRLRSVFTTLCSIRFLKPILLSILVLCIHCFSGKMVCAIYAIDVLKKISNSESTAYTGMLTIDAVTVTSMYLGCILSKFLRRRVMLFSFSIIGVAIMVCMSIYLYLAKLGTIEENKYISLLFLATYSVAISCGPMIMCTTIVAEFLPLKFRVLSLCTIAILTKIIYGTFLKISPFCFQTLGIYGTFALYAILTSICLVLVYYYVPETKNKTIQEIDDCMNGREKKVTEENHELMN